MLVEDVEPAAALHVGQRELRAVGGADHAADGPEDDQGGEPARATLPRLRKHQRPSLANTMAPFRARLDRRIARSLPNPLLERGIDPSISCRRVTTAAADVHERSERTTLVAFGVTVLLGAGNPARRSASRRAPTCELGPFQAAVYASCSRGRSSAPWRSRSARSFPRGRRARPGPCSSGALQFGIGFACIYYGYAHTPAGLGQVLQACIPLLTFVLALAHRQERFRWSADSSVPDPRDRRHRGRSSASGVGAGRAARRRCSRCWPAPPARAESRHRRAGVPARASGGDGRGRDW